MIKYEYEIQGNYGQGWETECTEDTLNEAQDQLKCYRENSPYPSRIKKVKVETTEVWATGEAK